MCIRDSLRAQRTFAHRRFENVKKLEEFHNYSSGVEDIFGETITVFVSIT